MPYFEKLFRTAVSGNSINYKVTYDTTRDKFIIEEEGSNLKLKELRLLWQSGAATTQAAAAKLGFNAADDVYSPPTSNNEARWGIFPTLINLKGYLQTNDVAGISKSITKLDDHFDHISSTISDMGSKMLRMEIKKTILQEMDITNTDRLSKIEDADITDAIMDLKMREVAYQAALAAAVRVLNLSLVDYLR